MAERACENEWGLDLQHAADCGDGGEEIDIVELWHVHVGEEGGRRMEAQMFLRCAGIVQAMQGFPHQTNRQEHRDGAEGKEKERKEKRKKRDELGKDEYVT